MADDKIPADIKKDLENAATLHQRATSDYNKCVEFNKTMSNILARLEDAGCYRTADKVMTILLSCAPKEGSSCDKATIAGEQMQRLTKKSDLNV